MKCNGSGEMEKIRIIIADDEKLIREGLKIIISSFGDIEVLELCQNGREAFEYCRGNKVDVVLMDIRMPECDGVLGTRLIKESCPDTKVLILTTFQDSEYIQQSLNNGASGYLLKNSSYDSLHEGIRTVYNGNAVIHSEVLPRLMVKDKEKEVCDKQKIKHDTTLTDRELNIIEEIANGLSNKEISDKLFLTEGTIKNNITTILSKLSLRDRTQIAIYAFKNSIVK
jgi:DNA-binding NarL/FixJ family response regulator